MVHKKGRMGGQCFTTRLSVAQTHCMMTLLSSTKNRLYDYYIPCHPTRVQNMNVYTEGTGTTGMLSPQVEVSIVGQHVYSTVQCKL